MSVCCTFLQKCSLLWELINYSASSPFNHENQVTCGSVNHQHNVLDIAEVERLESMVEIPPIDDVINDGMSRLMATIWLDHFTNKFKLQEQNVLYCTLSVPLSLVDLPDLFEDLIKASGCRAHAMACGAGIGAFLRTSFMIQRAGRSPTWASRYLDKFGEEDLNFRRGKPLHLGYKRYLDLTKTVASHGETALYVINIKMGCK
ncbi:hypothetical protein OROHE_019351 [Orobanche hederae]